MKVRYQTRAPLPPAPPIARPLVPPADPPGQIEQIDTKPVPQQEAMVPVIRCPHCGSGHRRTWYTLSGGRGEPYRICRGCGAVYRFLPNGTMARVR